MCGICGVVFRDKGRPVHAEDISRMCKAITHRGPDDEGYFVDANVGLGMRRLSIIDLVTGKQPIANEDGTVHIVFNGEIYNHLDLRKELERKGHRFSTNTDTESILHAYEEWGVDCPQKLNGMFAFAIWDAHKNRLFLARDRIGIKPLYYYYDARCIVFGSELKSILQIKDIPKKVDLKALDNFLTFEYIPSPLSIFEGIAKLPPAHWLVFDGSGVKTRKYWNLEYRSNGASEKENCERLVYLLQDSVSRRLMSDVPLGAFLSGGIDSSSIVALMSRVTEKPIKTFSIGFDDATYNELNYANTVAKRFGTEHQEFIIQPDALELAEKLILQLDEPFGDFSIFPTFLVSQMARKYVTVVLSGDGGDELFAGYDTYLAQKAARFYDGLPTFLKTGIIEPLLRRTPPTEKKKGLINRAKRYVEGAAYPDHLKHVRWMIFLSQLEKSRLYSPDVQATLDGTFPYTFIENHFTEINSDDDLDRQQYVDIMTYLVDDILVKVDRMSMAVSLEARVPFLDHRVVEFAATIPSRLRLKGNQTKYVLKKAMVDILPREILNRGKEGFSIPIKNWLKNELKPMMLDTLSENRLRQDGFFEPKYVARLIDDHLNGVENHSHRLWALMMFTQWHDIYMKS